MRNSIQFFFVLENRKLTDESEQERSVSAAFWINQHPLRYISTHAHTPTFFFFKSTVHYFPCVSSHAAHCPSDAVLRKKKEESMKEWITGNLMQKIEKELLARIGEGEEERERECVRNNGIEDGGSQNRLV